MLVVTGFILSLAGQAFAHAHLKAAMPADKETVSSPEEIDLSFSEAINMKFSGIKLTGPDSKDVKLGEPMLMEDDKMLMAPVNEKLPAGQYTIEWHVLSKDGHKTNGSYSFTVKP